MQDEMKAKIKKYLTAAAVVAVGAAVAIAPSLYEDGSVTKTDLVALGLAVLGALRLWASKELSTLPVLLGAEQEQYFKREMRIPFPETRNNLMSLPPGPVEVRLFSDEKLQAAVEHAFKVADRDGKKNGMFFNVNVHGEVMAGVAVKVGGHLSISGFLEKRPGAKLEGLAEATFTF